MLAREDIPGLVILGLGAVALAAFFFRGCLSPNALRDGPPRRTGLGLADLGIGLGLWLVGQLLFPAVLATLYPDATFETLDAVPLSMGALVMLSQGVGYGLPVAYLLLRVSFAGRHGTQLRTRGWRQLGVIPRQPGRELRLTALAILSGVPLVMAILIATRLVAEWMGLPAPPVAHELLVEIQQIDEPGELLLLIAAVVVLAPLLEEAFFRGLMQSALLGALGPGRRWTIILIVSAAFALVHLGGVSWHALPGLFVLGVIMGWTYEKTGSLWPAIGLHAAFNVLNVALVRFAEFS